MELYITFPMIFAVIWATGANIEILSERNAVECGTKHTLTCNVKEYSSAVTWMFENDVIPIAKCLRNLCNLNPDYVEMYEFTYDVDQGVYNLTIINVTITDIGRKFVCSNGYDSVSKAVSFKVTELKALLYEDTDNKMLSASSSCILPETNVVIKWVKIDANDNQESDHNPELLHTKTKICSNDSVCGINKQIQHLVVISAEPSCNGKYYLKIKVAYENEIIESSITTLKYNVEEKDFKSIKLSDDKKIDDTANVSLLAVNACFLVMNVAVVIVVVLIICKRDKNELHDGLSCFKRCRDKRADEVSTQCVQEEPMNLREITCRNIDTIKRYYSSTDCAQNLNEYKSSSNEEEEEALPLSSIRHHIREFS